MAAENQVSFESRPNVFAFCSPNLELQVPEVCRYFVTRMHASWVLKLVTLQASGKEEVTGVRGSLNIRECVQVCGSGGDVCGILGLDETGLCDTLSEGLMTKMFKTCGGGEVEDKVPC